MLRLLRIRNLAVIESVEVEFEPGFNVLTGETGAGKSILVEAVGLLLGARASADLVRTGEAQASIEALFEREDGSELIVRREITAQGRSRAYVNGQLATAAELRTLSADLVELHGQHEHQALLDPLTHLPLLDAYAHLQSEAEMVATAWSRVRDLRAQLDRSRMDAREKSARLELIAFQLSEIDKVGPKGDEDESLAATRQVLASADRVRRLCEEGYGALYESDGSALAILGGVWKRVAELATIDPAFAPYAEARDGVKSQLEDLAAFLRDYGSGVDASPARLQEVEDRLAAVERLKRKYGPTLAEVIERAAQLRSERHLLMSGDEQADEVQRQLQAASDEYLRAARALSHERRRAALTFARELESLLSDLAMTGSRFEVRFNPGELPAEAWSERGIDTAEFFLSPNVGEDLRALARIVSGGELSRVMLALKTLAAGAPDTPAARTLIFDEVDAGIGGRVADVVGSRLKDLGARFQVLCITHLAQIAARAGTHFRIEKVQRSGRTLTLVEPLTPERRVEEVGRMVGGAALTDAVRATARDLLQANADRQEPGRKANTGRKAKAKVRG